MDVATTVLSKANLQQQPSTTTERVAAAGPRGLNRSSEARQQNPSNDCMDYYKFRPQLQPWSSSNPRYCSYLKFG